MNLIQGEDLAGKAGAIFDNFDVDGDGSITEEEFVAGEVEFISCVGPAEFYIAILMIFDG